MESEAGDAWFGAKELVGVTSMRHFKRRSKNIWVIGEQHDEMPHSRAVAAHPQHIARVILEGVAHSENPVHLYLEVPYDFYNAAHLCRLHNGLDKSSAARFESEASCLRKLYYAHFSRHIPPNVRTHFCNVRYSLPFGLFYLWTDPAQFRETYAAQLNNMYNSTNLPALCKKWAKELEKRFLENVADGDGTIAFFESLLFPGNAVPEWFANVEADIFKSSSGANPTKDALQMLLTSDPTYYEHVQQTFLKVLGLLVKRHGHHTRVLSKMKRRHGKRDTPVVYTVWLKNYFFVLISLIQDVYMAAVYGNMRRGGQSHIFIAGDLHASFLTALMGPRASQFHAWEHRGDFVIRPDYTVAIKKDLPNMAEGLLAFQNDPSPQEGGGESAHWWVPPLPLPFPFPSPKK